LASNHCLDATSLEVASKKPGWKKRCFSEGYSEAEYGEPTLSSQIYRHSLATFDRYFDIYTQKHNFQNKNFPHGESQLQAHQCSVAVVLALCSGKLEAVSSNLVDSDHFG
jgi:hypothetical protein